MFETLFGAEMPLPVRFFIAFLIVLALIGLTALIVRRFGAERLGGTTPRGRQPRSPYSAWKAVFLKAFWASTSRFG